MKRWYRYAAFILALALLIPLCAFSVAAEESVPYIIIYKRYNSDGTIGDTEYTAPVADGFISATGLYGISIVGFKFSPSIFNGLDSIVLDFRIAGYFSGNSVTSLAMAWPSGATLGTSDYATKIYASYAISGKNDTPFLDGDTYFSPSTNSIIYQLSFQTNNLNSTTTNSFRINLNNPMNIRASGSHAGQAIWIKVSDINLMIGNGLANQFYMNYNSLYSILNSYFTNLTNALFAVYQWAELNYNPNTGTIEVSQESGNWFEAVLGSIQSLNADAQAQAEQQEKAKDVGAEDALDEAYGKSSFFDVIPILDFADFGDYDDDIVEDLAGDGPLDWFSSTTQNDLDQAAVRYGDDEEFYSFYQTNIDEIEDILSGDRARRRNQ